MTGTPHPNYNRAELEGLRATHRAAVATVCAAARKLVRLADARNALVVLIDRESGDPLCGEGEAAAWRAWHEAGEQGPTPPALAYDLPAELAAAVDRLEEAQAALAGAVMTLSDAEAHALADEATGGAK